MPDHIEGEGVPIPVEMFEGTIREVIGRLERLSKKHPRARISWVTPWHVEDEGHYEIWRKR